MSGRYYYKVSISASPLIACFGQPVTFTAKALRIWTKGERKGKIEDVTSEVVWRKPAAGSGAKYTKVWYDRINTRVAAYLGNRSRTSIDVKIVCCALDQDSDIYNTNTQLLARMMMGEGSTVSDKERIAMGYAAVNRYRFQPHYFKANLNFTLSC